MLKLFGSFMTCLVLTVFAGCPPSTRCHVIRMEMGHRMANATVGLIHRYKAAGPQQKDELPTPVFENSFGVFEYKSDGNKLIWKDGKSCFVNVDYLESLSQSATNQDGGNTIVLVASPSQIGCDHNLAIICFDDASYRILSLSELSEIMGAQALDELMRGN